MVFYGRNEKVQFVPRAKAYPGPGWYPRAPSRAVPALTLSYAIMAQATFSASARPHLVRDTGEMFGLDMLPVTHSASNQ